MILFLYSREWSFSNSRSVAINVMYILINSTLSVWMYNTQYHLRNLLPYVYLSKYHTEAAFRCMVPLALPIITLFLHETSRETGVQWYNMPLWESAVHGFTFFTHNNKVLPSTETYLLALLYFTYLHCLKHIKVFGSNSLCTSGWKRRSCWISTTCVAGHISACLAPAPRLVCP